MKMEVRSSILLLVALLGLAETQIVYDRPWALMQTVPEGNVFALKDLIANGQRQGPQQGSGSLPGNLANQGGPRLPTGTRNTPVVHREPAGTQRAPVVQPEPAGTQRTPVVQRDPAGTQRTPVVQRDPAGTQRTPVIQQQRPKQPAGTQRIPASQQNPEQPAAVQATPVFKQRRPQQQPGTPQRIPVSPQSPRQQPGTTQRIPVSPQSPRQQPGTPQRIPVSPQSPRQQPGTTQRIPVSPQSPRQQPGMTQRIPVSPQSPRQQPGTTQRIPVSPQSPRQQPGMTQRIPVSPQSPRQQPGTTQRIPVSPQSPRQQAGTQRTPVGQESAQKAGGFSGSRVVPEGRHPSCEIMPSPGECRAAFPRYYFNTKTSQCDCFLYGGCGKEGLVSSYRTLRECHEKCLPRNMVEGPQCKEVFRDDQAFFSFLVPKKQQQQQQQQQKQQQQQEQQAGQGLSTQSQALERPSTVVGRPFPDTSHINDQELLERLEEGRLGVLEEDSHDSRRF
ncbi:uncharacterized protein [Panulirus ornatus]|uniref:uncharacterized protein n=1 Tax=Panulirus ornatus TaxID=150431 RepID=UPI003A85C326